MHVVGSSSGRVAMPSQQTRCEVAFPGEDLGISWGREAVLADKKPEV